MRLLLLNIQGKGPISGTLGEFRLFFLNIQSLSMVSNVNLSHFIENTRAVVRLTAKRTPSNGQEYVKFDNLSLKVTVGAAKFRLENLFNGDRTLGEYEDVCGVQKIK